MQRQPDSGSAPPRASRTLEGGGPPPIVGVAQLRDQIKSTLLEGPKDEKTRAVEWLNSYNIADIAATLTFLNANGLLDELAKHASVRPLVEVSIKAVKSPLSVTDDDVLMMIDGSQRAEFRAHFKITEDTFLPALEALCSELGCRAEHLLAPIMSESISDASGLRPGAMNPDSHAVGLIQFMPSTLRDLGFKGGPVAFAKLNATDQMHWIGAFFREAKGKLTSPGRVHQFMFLPASIDRVTSSNDAITRKDHPNPKFREAYEANAKNLDPRGTGAITLGMLEAIDARKMPAAQAALATLRARSQPVRRGPPGPPL